MTARQRVGRHRPLSALVVLVLISGVVAALVHDGNGGGLDHPEQWDQRVVDLAEFVEDERDLRWDHPVHVDFLSEEEFIDFVLTDEATLTEEDKDEIEDAEAFLRALGLIAGDVDVFEAFNELVEVNVLALYDFEEQRVRVKGTEMTPFLRATLVHELTHALQDQHFDVGRVAEVEEETESSTYRGLVEGDAERIRTAYVETLDGEQAAALDAEQTAASEAADAAELPAVLEAVLAAPYDLGGPLVSAIVETDGVSGLNDVLRDPPTTDEPLFDPLGYLETGDGEGVEVDVAELEDGEEEVDRGFFGPIGWYVTLAHRIDTRVALEAVDGWGGDSYVVYERDGTTCVRIAYRGDSTEDAGQLEQALATWVAEMPPGTATVRRQRDDGLVLQSCDPGEEASAPEDVDGDSLLLAPAVRASLAALVLGQGGNPEQARCFAEGVIARLSDEQLVADDELDAAAAQAIAEIGARCRSV